MTTPKDRYEQREEVLMALAVLFHPLKEMLASGDLSQLSSVRAAFFHNWERFWQEYVVPFGTVNHVSFSTELNLLIEAIHLCRHALSVQLPGSGGPADIAAADSNLGEYLKRAKAAIRSIPCDVPGFILEANTPFQSYCKLHSIVQGAQTRIDLLDPYLDAEVYHRYLSDIDSNVKITVVMSKEVTDPKNAKRLARIVAISKLLAAERPNNYRLLTADIHDRHLRADDRVFHLGGSAKDMATKKPYTVSNVEPASGIVASLDAMILGGDEWFGLTTTTHRTA